MEKIIKLKSVEIIGFQSKNKKLKVDFSNRNSSIIYGKNGSGKTTFLRIINAILKQNSSVLSSLNIKNIKILFTVNDIKKSVSIVPLDSQKIEKIYISDSRPIDELRSTHNIQKDDNGYYIEQSINGNPKYDWTEFLKSDLTETSSLSLGIERGITQNLSNINGEDIYHFFRSNRRYSREFRNINLHEMSEDLSNFLKQTKHKNRNRRRAEDSLSLRANHVFLQNIKMDNIEELLLEIYIKAKNTATERIQNALFDTLSFIFENKSKKDFKKEEIDIEFTESLLKTKSRIIEALDEDYNDNKFKSRMIKILKEINTEEDIKNKVDNRILYDLIKNMMKELEIEKSLLNSINIFIERYNKFLGDEKQLIITENQIYIRIDNEQHPINILSSGERHIFTFLVLIIIEGRNRDFIIIDEPEISLNIKWQRALMTLLEELAPNTQIIVASHSPFLAKKMPDALVELLSEKV